MGSGMHENGSHDFSSRSTVIRALMLRDFGVRFKVVAFPPVASKTRGTASSEACVCVSVRVRVLKTQCTDGVTLSREAVDSRGPRTRKELLKKSSDLPCSSSSV